MVARPIRKLPTPQQLGLSSKFDKWRAGQEEGLDVIITSQKRAKVICGPTGWGKSPVAVAAALISQKPTCIVTATNGLLQQYMSDYQNLGMVSLMGKRQYKCDFKPEDPTYTCEEGQAVRCPYKGSIGCPASQAEIAAATSPLVVTNYAKWCKSKVYGQGMAHFQQVIFDEGHCFVAGTPVRAYIDSCKFKDVPIEELKIGMEVTAFNEESKAYLPIRKITRVFKQEVSLVYKLKFSDGSHVVCTSGHPFYTGSGWVKAADIRHFMLCLKHGNYSYQLSHVRGTSQTHRSPKEIRLSQIREGLLWPLVCNEDNREDSQNISRTAGITSAENANQESYVKSVSQSPGQHLSEISWVNAGIERREWERTHPAAENYGTDSWLGDGGACGIKQLDSRSGQKLQTGYSPQGSEDRYRDRRQESHQRKEPKEDFGPYWVRLDSVEIYESSDRQRFKQVCPDGFVYNIEVEEDHTYLANQFVVHNCMPDALAEELQVIISRKEIEEGLQIDFPEYKDQSDMIEWKRWASNARAIAEVAMLAAQARITGIADPKPAWVKHYTHMRNLVRRLAVINTCRADDWIVDEIDGGYQFDPIRPGRYAESNLLFKMDSIIVVSATVHPKTMYMIGVGKDQFEFKEFDSDFKPSRCPLYYLPIMRVDAKAGSLDKIWLTLDQFASRRRDRNGIVHTISYTRREEILNASHHAQRMIFNERGQPISDTIDKYRSIYPGAIMVTPSVEAGYDFRMRECEWQFICKIPFDPPSKILKAREAVDPEYRAYRAIQRLNQIPGRGMRSKEDQCETLIGDMHLDWFLPKYRHLTSKSFQRFFRPVSVLPQPPERL